MRGLNCAECDAFEGSGRFARLSPIGEGETIEICPGCLGAEYDPVSQAQVAKIVGETIGNPDDQFWVDRRSKDVYLQSDDDSARNIAWD